MMTKTKIILKELKELLAAKFGDDINRVILFGSRVEGRARKYSDYDVLIVVARDYDWKYKHRIQDACWEIDYKFDVLTDVKIISLSELNTLKGKQPYILNALENGLTA